MIPESLVDYLNEKGLGLCKRQGRPSGHTLCAQDIRCWGRVQSRKDRGSQVGSLGVDWGRGSELWDGKVRGAMQRGWKGLQSDSGACHAGFELGQGGHSRETLWKRWHGVRDHTGLLGGPGSCKGGEEWRGGAHRTPGAAPSAGR